MLRVGNVYPLPLDKLTINYLVVGGWVLKDVCEVLEISDVRRVAERLDIDEWSQTPVTDSLGRKQNTYIINESGLYNVILRSDKPEAKPFRKWVSNDVLEIVFQQ